MNRHHLSPSLRQITHRDVSQETAIHEAGHATAIYLGNQYRQLPAVFFQISIKREAPCKKTLTAGHKVHNSWIAKVDGGRLIQTLGTCMK